jgi:hypothetical protein
MPQSGSNAGPTPTRLFALKVNVPRDKGKPWAHKLKNALDFLNIKL